MRGLRRGLAGTAVVATALFGCSAASARTITVATTDANSNTVCTIVDAITAANDNLATGGCLAGQGLPTVDKINFSPAVIGTISLGLASLPQLTQDVEIGGPGASALTVEGATRPFEVLPGTTATISGLTIKGTCSDVCGSQGGAILNAGELTLDSVAITNSSAVSSSGADSTAEGGAIFNQVGGVLTVNGSILTDNAAVANGGSTSNAARGAVVFNAGTMTLARSTFKDNNAIATAATGTTGTTEGGAISTSGAATITRSTFSTNDAINNGVGSGSSQGGAIRNDFGSPGSLTIENSTIVDNYADPTAANSQGGGLYLSGSQVAIRSATISGNSATDGGNLQVATVPAVSNSIVTSPSTGPNCSGSPVSSAGYNIESADTCGFGAAGDMTTTDPMLQPLGNYGGPTQTRPPMTGSPAIDAGKAVVFETTDQRGLLRPSDFLALPNAAGGDGSDIGAVEVQDPNTPPDTVIDSGPAENSLSNDPTPTFAFHSTEANSSFECRVGSSAFAVCPSPKTVAALSDGTHTFEVRAIDDTQKTDPSPAVRSFVIDTTGPTAKIAKLPKTTTKTKLTVRFSTTESGADFQCKVDDKSFKRCHSPLKLKGLRTGKHKLQVRATDELGNQGKTAKASFKVVRKK